MATELIRQLTPEEEELHRKREELAAVRATLADRELELADLRAELKSFEGRYLREVGVLYAELDEWEARIAELEASLNPSPAADEQARDARQRANETQEAAHGETAQSTAHFKPSENLRKLFREAAKRMHPDFGRDDADRERRTRLMAQANEAYSRGDAEALQAILDSFKDSPEDVQGEGTAAELVRTIRQIHQAKKKIAAIERELAELRASEIALLKADAEKAKFEGRELLEELAERLSTQIVETKKRHERCRKDRCFD